MKSLILSAGFGTRLRPYTEHTPKPLFPISGRPLLDIIIRDLKKAGSREIIINTHWLHEKIHAFLADQNYGIPVKTVYEPEILDTGGAIRNLKDFWDDEPFIVVNSDILTNIDIKKVYNFHLDNPYSATLVLHDYKVFNNVSVSKDDFITGFHETEDRLSGDSSLQLAFTGIQVIDPKIVSMIPENTFYSSIDLYKNLISKNKKIKAYIAKHHSWKDIGTPEAYQEAASREIQKLAFKKVFPGSPDNPIHTVKLAGDGSDRQWFRLTKGKNSMIMVDHGIREHTSVCEADSFIEIGNHLYGKNINVPQIYAHDSFSGLVCVEDLGDNHLKDVIQNTEDREKVPALYKNVIKLLLDMSLKGIKDLDLSKTYQTDTYTKELIIEKECRYFVDAFLTTYLGMDVVFDTYLDEFAYLADKALEHAVLGFMHRDFQSQNIMVKNNSLFFIDFQGGRLGPIQYDLASLLIDPYVALPFSLQTQLAEYCMEKISSCISINKDNFRNGFKYCALTRNLQILGAFGFLSQVKGKTWFEQHIPFAVKSLKHYLKTLEKDELPDLKMLVKDL